MDNSRTGKRVVPVGLELSQSMRRFGSKVSVIDRNDRVLHNEDEDVSAGLRDLFEDQGIDLVLNARVKKVSGKSGREVKVVIQVEMRDAMQKAS